MMTHRKSRLLAVGAVLLAVAAGCGSSSNSGSGARSVTIGVITDLTGAASSGNSNSVQGVKAGVVLAKRDGYTIKYIVGDTATSPATALAAARKLVTQDHVLAVIAHSALFFAAAPYLKAQNVPVVGFAEDGDEWTTDLNMFSISGPLETNLVTATQGLYFKMEGVTSLGAIGYSVSPSSAGAAKAAAASAKAAGIREGYLNAAFPFGSTNVGPETIAMKNAGVDGFTAEVDPNTAFAFVTGLRQEGVNLKAALFPTGYGGDLLSSGPGALQAAQNVSFGLTFEPVEMHTAATEQFQKDLAAAGVRGEPTYSEYNGYLSVALLVQGLKAAGSTPTHASLINALSGIHAWDALGLWGGRTLDINNRNPNTQGVDNCLWVTKFVGSSFQLVPGADPICGNTLGTL